MRIDAKTFFDLESRLRAMGLDSDNASFDEIRENLSHKKTMRPGDFAAQTIYVILAGGFSQKTAKVIYQKIMDLLCGGNVDYDSLFPIFHNKNKINAIVNVWQNREKFAHEYYALKTLDDKLKYLEKMPHIGHITANHLARNLGENIVKYDVWIQRLGAAYTGADTEKINNQKLNPDIKNACDKMFDDLEKSTGLPRGYIDVVLWKSCQNKLISLDACLY